MSDHPKEPTSKPRHIYHDAVFRTLVEQSSDVIQLVSAQCDVLYSSDSVRQVLGFAPDEIQGANVIPHVHPDDIKEFTVCWKRLLKKPGAQATLTYRVQNKDGNWMWIEAAATNHLHTPGIEAVVGNFRNVSDRKGFEARLRESEEQYRLLSDLSPDGIAVHAGGKIVYVNAAAARMVGARAPEELIGQPLMQFVHPDYIDQVKERVQVIMTEHRPTELVEEKFIRLDGQIIDVEAISIPFRYHGSPAVQVVIRDITERKRAAEALQREHKLEMKALRLSKQRSQLVALNRAKDEFIALASHQLRTPATAVKQFLGMLSGGYAGQLNDEQTHMVGLAYESNERQISIINDLLEVARVDADKVTLTREKVDLAALVDHVIREQRSTLDARQQIISYLPGERAVQTMLDPIKIRMVIENLLDNASKYSPEGGMITVSLELTPDMVRIVVSDNGVGIAPTDQERLFRKFSRIDNPVSIKVGGTGLGLYWAKRIIDLHEGTIEVQSDVGEGSTFTVRLPLRTA